MVTTKVSTDRCCGCHACATACPKNCIRMVADAEGFLYPVCDEAACVNCNRCEVACPLLRQWKMNGQSETEAYAVINLDEHIRISSSSGGVFTALANEVLLRGGVVFGAAFSGDFKSVYHISAESTEDLGRLRGSKYMQSEMGNTYALVKEHLNSGREVLFSGTPCQIGGLNTYLGRQYDNLFTLDIICHGVPSSLLWKEYLDEKECEAGADVTYVTFRSKESGWKNYSIRIVFSNGSEYNCPFHEDSYMKAFLGDYCLRPSCYDCAFKSIQRQSDITLGDFWGIEKEFPELDDDKGTSIALLHSEKGKRLFACLSETMNMCSVTVEEALKYNPAAVCSAHINPNREILFNGAKRGLFVKTMKRLSKHSWRKRIVDFTKRLLR